MMEVVKPTFLAADTSNHKEGDGMDREVVVEAMSGNSSAMEKILKENYQQLYKTAFLYVKNEADALDIVQEAVIKILQKLKTLEKPEFFTTWAVRIVIWTAIDFLRKARSHSELPDEQLAIPEAPLSRDEQLDIYTAIGLLPQHLQEITILHYFYGKKLKEISQVSGEPLGTIKYKLHEARRMLKNYLEEGEPDEAE